MYIFNNSVIIKWYTNYAIFGRTFAFGAFFIFWFVPFTNAMGFEIKALPTTLFSKLDEMPFELKLIGNFCMLVCVMSLFKFLFVEVITCNVDVMILIKYLQVDDCNTYWLLHQCCGSISMSQVPSSLQFHSYLKANNVTINLWWRKNNWSTLTRKSKSNYVCMATFIFLVDIQLVLQSFN